MKENLLERIDSIRGEALDEVAKAANAREVEACRIKYLGRNGSVTAILKMLRDVEPSNRPVVGQKINELKVLLEEKLSGFAVTYQRQELNQKFASSKIDVSLAGRALPLGHRHPLMQVMDEIVGIFTDMGFSVHTGPDVETDYYNFEALNVSADHPARDMQDTFYVEGGNLLRTHTSPVQIHVMENLPPPIFAVFPGAVYRRDNDVTHSPMFHQVEGLVVDEHITMADLKGVLETFSHKIFGGKLAVRFRPSFFPFTEPSAELDISCVICGGKGCRVCKNSGWLEILGCGMVDPAVFAAVKFDFTRFSGFAFGMGVERIAMLKYAIDDIRLFYENDLRFLEQF